MTSPRLLLSLLSLATLICGAAVFAEEPPRVPFRIEVHEKGSGWPIPLAELRTTDQVRFVTDNAGVVAFDLPDRIGKETWLSISSPGYEAPADGFGFRGVRVTPQWGGAVTIELQRTSIARRIGRLTGSGFFAESQKCGLALDWSDGPLTGCDSVQMARYDGVFFWSWGDTNISKYPLGNFAMTGATTRSAPFDRFEPPLRPKYDYFLKNDGVPAPMAALPGPGPKWLWGYAALPDAEGKEHLVATYRKIEGKLRVYELGLCEWAPERKQFQPVKVLWNKSQGGEPPSHAPFGHTVIYTDEKQVKWVLYGDPFPKLKHPASYESWKDPSQWERVESPEMLEAAESGERVRPHTGSIAYSLYRRAWVAIFMQFGGKPSAFGELWYAEAPSPFGPWGKAVKVLSHENYTFYNPRVLMECTPEEASFLLFEGTYTAEFADRPFPTPRYDYNQILYRIDLDDPKLAAARIDKAE